MEHTVTVMQWYVVTGTAGATVSTPEGVTLCTIPDGGQGTFFAITPIVVTSDDSVSVVKATFKYAPAKLKALGILGGGEDALPNGYLRAAFVYADGNQFIDTGLRRVDESSCAEFSGEVISNYPWSRRAFQTRGLAFSTESRTGPGAWWVALPFGVDAAVSSMITRPVNMPNDHISPQYNVRIEYKRAIINGEVYTEVDMSAPSNSQTSDSDNTLKLFAYSDGVNHQSTWWVGTCRRFKAKAKNGEVNFTPAIAPNGKPCMFDKVSKNPFYNSGTGEFVVGMTLAQARKLGKLPAGGGTLTVSLPSNYGEDESFANAKAEAEAKGWEITIRIYEATSGVSTFALRRIWVRKTQAAGGEYVAADGSRWHVDWCVEIVGADPLERGYEPFRSVDAAVAYWELTPYVHPEEELLTEE